MAAHCAVPFLLATLVMAATPLAAQVPRLEPVGTIGCGLCDGPAAFDAVQALAVAADGRILVTDRSEPVVRIFRPDGTVVLAHGRRGEGPGEHRLAIHVAPLPGGGHETYDMALRRRTAFDVSGEVLTTTPVAGFPDAASRAPGGPLYLTTVDFSTFTRTLARWDAGAAEPVPLETVRPDPEEASDHARLHLAAAPDDGLAMGHGELRYVIHRRDAAGAPRPALMRDVPRPRRTAAELEEARERRAAGAARLAEMARAEGGSAARGDVPVEENHFAGLAYDEAGRLWVLTNRGDLTRSVVDVFGADGAYLGEVAVPHRLSRLALGAGLLVAVAVDGEGVERLRLWAIR